ncbi:unnamed protein product [Linum tenue]|uniref:Uncharacterized protein n=1 Tax=Linum tenue TaxID=586396 RepID=A0AAV0H8C0_9ROSI|nr:unnamed protein product [Linum tenue]
MGVGKKTAARIVDLMQVCSLAWTKNVNELTAAPCVLFLDGLDSKATQVAVLEKQIDLDDVVVGVTVTIAAGLALTDE